MEGGAVAPTTEKPQPHPGTLQANAVSTVTRSVSDTADPRVINARTEPMPTLQRSEETLRGDASGTELGSPGENDRANQRGVA